MRVLPLPPLVRGITFPELTRLRGEREQVDETLLAFTREAGEAFYEQPLRYVNSAGEAHAKPCGLVLRHVFNHQTHHRGQATTLFSQFGIDVGVTDLSALIPEL